MKWCRKSGFGGETAKEVVLEKKGAIYALQQYRQQIVVTTPYEFGNPILWFLRAEYDLRATVQREILLSEELTKRIKRIQRKSNRNSRS
jgi:hypothetical protein